MNKKLLSLAVAAAMVTPIAAHADVKVSGVIQAEIASLEVAEGDENLNASLRDGVFDDMDRQTLTYDSFGTILNEGPNHIQFDIDEKLGGGVKAQARYIMGFNTSGNFGFSPIGEEAWVGLGAAHFHVRYGTLTGAYKSSHTLVDPLAFTSLQTRGTGGGMSGEYFNLQGYTDPTDPNKVTEIGVNFGYPGGLFGLTNDGFVEGALELGVNYSGFSATLQGFIDETSVMDGAGLFELRYTAPGDFFTMWLAGAYTDVSDTFDRITSDFADKFRKEENKKNLEDSDFSNWKIGGAFKLGPMVKLGLQYEESEIGNLDFFQHDDGGKYILGSLEVTPVQNISLAGWVAGYLSDIDDVQRMVNSEGNAIDEDALSWAVAAKYRFSTRTMLYTGYRQTDSDNDFRDENIITLGLRHSF